MRKENNIFGHLFKGILSGLHHEKKMSHAGRGSVGRRCVIYSGPTSLSVSDCTMLPQSFLTTTTTGSACWEAVLDTNLSSVNKSQAHQPECCSWQSAPVVYERQIVQREARGLGFLQQPRQCLVNIMFTLCIIFRNCYFLIFIHANWVNQRSQHCIL